ncbi:MAG: MFS family permease [Candidatus Latescibacterota bacterium]|jgi:MFS family permease
MNALIRNPLILPVYVPTFLLSFCRGLIIPILPFYAKSFDISYTLVGVILAAEGIGSILGALPTSIVINKLGRKNAMILGVLMVAFSVAGLFFAPSVIVVLLLRLISGVGGSIWNISRHAYLTDVTSPNQRGRALSIFGGVNRIGTFAGPAVGGILAAAFTLRTPFLAFGAIAIITAIVAAFTVERRDTPVVISSKGHIHHIAGIFHAHYRILCTAGVGQLFAQTIRNGRYVFIPLFGADVLGLDVDDVAYIMSFSGFIDMLVFPVAGVIMDRFGRKFAMIPCFAIQAIGMACIPFTGNYYELLGVTCLIGFGNGIGSGTMMTLGADLAPKENVGEFLSFWRLIGDGGQMGAPMIVGRIADMVGLSPAAFVIAGIGLAASGIFLFFVPETLQKPPPQPTPSQNKHPT